MNPIALIFLLIAAGVVLLIGEMLLPAHGALGIAAVLCFGGAMIVLFRMNQWIGLGIFLAAVVASPLLANLAMQIWFKSPVGRRIILPPMQTTSRPTSVKLGQIGVTVTELRPSGDCDFDDQRIEAFAQLGTIAAGEKVKVIAIDNGRPTVRVIET